MLLRTCWIRIIFNSHTSSTGFMNVPRRRICTWQHYIECGKKNNQHANIYCSHTERYCTQLIICLHMYEWWMCACACARIPTTTHRAARSWRTCASSNSENNNARAVRICVLPPTTLHYNVYANMARNIKCVVLYGAVPRAVSSSPPYPGQRYCRAVSLHDEHSVHAVRLMLVAVCTQKHSPIRWMYSMWNQRRKCCMQLAYNVECVTFSFHISMGEINWIS